MGGFEKGAQGADDPYASLLWPVTRILTANEMLSQSAGLRLMITYLALYRLRLHFHGSHFGHPAALPSVRFDTALPHPV